MVAVPMFADGIDDSITGLVTGYVRLLSTSRHIGMDTAAGVKMEHSVHCVCKWLHLQGLVEKSLDYLHVLSGSVVGGQMALFSEDDEFDYGDGVVDVPAVIGVTFMR